MPLILTQNEINSDEDFNYHDIEGVQYQYPNMYVNMINPGTKFIYYRGAKNSEGKRRIPEYFGFGIISSTELDSPYGTPKSSRKWVATIDEYKPFPVPIKFKDSNGYLEPGAERNGYFQQGVRKIDVHTFNVLREAGIPHTQEKTNGRGKSVDEDFKLPRAFSDLKETLAAQSSSKKGDTGKAKGRNKASHHKAKWVGDLAELIVYKFLKKQSWAHDIKWLEQEGIRPGWDIEYKSKAGELHRVEVKGTTLSRMNDCNITGNEWRAASIHGSAFSLYLVTGVGGKNIPKLSKVENPAVQVNKQPELLESTAYKLNLSGLEI